MKTPKSRPLWARTLCGFLAFNLLFPMSAFSLGTQKSEKSITVSQSVKDFYSLALESKVLNEIAADDSFFNFYSSPEIEDIADQQIAAIDHTDPIVDQDPFLLRSQHWSTNANGQAIWNLHAPLIRIFEGADFYIYAVKPGSGFLDRLSDTVTGERSDGFFYVLKTELQEFSESRYPVPVYFFPLPQAEWSETLPWALENAGSTQVTLVDSTGLMLAIDYEDILEMAKISRLNLSLSLDMSLPRPMPRPGYTAGFGTRIVLEKVLHDPNQASPEQKAELEQARQKMRSNLVRVSAILTGAFTAAVVLKYTLLKKRLQILDPETPPHIVAKLTRELRQVGDVFVHNLNTLSGIPSIWTANIIETLVDRYFTKLGAAENSLVRRGLNWFVFYSRNTAEKIPLNTKTFLFGAGMLGGIDTSFVYVQLDWAVPKLGHFIGSTFPSQTEAANNAFSPHNAITRSLVDFEIIRNLAGYATTGASGFTQQMQEIYEIPVHRMAVEEFKRKNLDHLAPENAATFKELKNKLLDKLLIDKGLPSKERFLFDAGILYQRINQLLSGIPDPQLAPSSYAQLGRIANSQSENFWLAKRPGLLVPALLKAKQKAEELATKHPADSEARHAETLLGELLKKVGLLETYIKNPIQKLFGITQIYNQTRKELMLLSYEGTIQDLNQAGIRFIPEQWKAHFGPGAASLASNLFRRSMMSLMSGNVEMLQPTDKNRAKFAKPTLESAQQKLIEKYSSEFEKISGHFPERDHSLAIQKLVLNHSAEFHLLHNDAILEASTLQAEKEAPATIPKFGFYEKGQLARARSRARKKLQLDHGIQKPISAYSPDEFHLERKIYSEELIKVLDLHMDFSDLRSGTEQQIDNEAFKHFQKQIEKEKVHAHLSVMDLDARLSIEGFWLAEFKIKEYMRLMHDPDFVGPKSTARPGRLQKFRQKSWVRGSRTLTFLSRSAEAFFSDDTYQIGLWNKIFRVVPFAYDYSTTAQRMVRKLFIMFTAGYAFNYFVYGLTLTYSQLGWFMITAFPFLFAVHPVFLRFFSNLGWKPMGKMRHMLVFATAWSWVSFFGSIPQFMYQKWFDGQMASLGAAISSGFGAISSLGKSCLTTLGKILAK